MCKLLFKAFFFGLLLYSCASQGHIQTRIYSKDILLAIDTGKDIGCVEKSCIPRKYLNLFKRENIVFYEREKAPVRVTDDAFILHRYYNNKRKQRGYILCESVKDSTKHFCFIMDFTDSKIVFSQYPIQNSKKSWPAIVDDIVSDTTFPFRTGVKTR